jgi:AcrR family transcriptional regulator
MKDFVRSPRKPKGAGAERREEILAIALRLFGERGVHAVSTRQIAAAAGISQPTLYAYFATKDDIAVELAVRAFATLRERVVAAAAGACDDGDRLDALTRVYIDFGLENPDAYRVAFMIEHDKGDDHPVTERFLAAGLEAFNAFLTAVRSLHAKGLTTDDDPERLTQNLWATSHGLVSLLIARPTFPWVEREGLIAAHVALLRRAALK